MKAFTLVWGEVSLSLSNSWQAVGQVGGGGGRGKGGGEDWEDGEEGRQTR